MPASQREPGQFVPGHPRYRTNARLHGEVLGAARAFTASMLCPACSRVCSLNPCGQHPPLTMRPPSRYAKWVGQASRPSKIWVACPGSGEQEVREQRQVSNTLNKARCPSAAEMGASKDCRCGSLRLPLLRCFRDRCAEAATPAQERQAGAHVNDGGPPLLALLPEELQQVEAAYHVHVHSNLVQQQHLQQGRAQLAASTVWSALHCTGGGGPSSNVLSPSSITSGRACSGGDKPEAASVFPVRANKGANKGAQPGRDEQLSGPQLVPPHTQPALPCRPAPTWYGLSRPMQICTRRRWPSDTLFSRQLRSMSSSLISLHRGVVWCGVVGGCGAVLKQVGAFTGRRDPVPRSMPSSWISLR